MGRHLQINKKCKNLTESVCCNPAAPWVQLHSSQQKRIKLGLLYQASHHLIQQPPFLPSSFIFSFSLTLSLFFFNLVECFLNIPGPEHNNILLSFSLLTLHTLPLSPKSSIYPNRCCACTELQAAYP